MGVGLLKRRKLLSILSVNSHLLRSVALGYLVLRSLSAERSYHPFIFLVELLL